MAFHSVRDVSFHCEQGEVLGLLGPNGAGKTTTLRMLLKALKPDAGLYGKLTAFENIAYFGCRNFT